LDWVGKYCFARYAKAKYTSLRSVKYGDPNQAPLFQPPKAALFQAYFNSISQKEIAIPPDSV